MKNIIDARLEKDHYASYIGCMKQPLQLFFFFGLGATLCQGQVAERWVLAAAGSSFNSQETVIEYTLGESVIQTFVGNNSSVTAGFHQSELFVTATERPLAAVYCSVYPNPTKRHFTIQTVVFSRSRYQLFSATGTQLEEGSFSRSATMDLSAQPPGIYLLQVTNNELRFAYTYRVVLE